jgi:hypothetical protein
MSIGRFQVMAILQACRAEVLGLDHDSALSRGLNRAIFYAAAKRGFRGRVSGGTEKERSSERDRNTTIFHLGDEKSFVNEFNGAKILFTIGGETQTPEDFRRQIEKRFQTKDSFDKAWQKAMSLVIIGIIRIPSNLVINFSMKRISQCEMHCRKNGPR